MEKIISGLNDKRLVALVVGLSLLAIFRSFRRR